MTLAARAAPAALPASARAQDDAGTDEASLAGEVAPDAEPADEAAADDAAPAE